MTLNKFIRATVAVAVLTLPATACRSSNAYDVDTPMPERAVLVVKNDNFLDMDVYAVSSGLPTRIGTVTGLNTAKFALNPTLYIAGDFRVVAAPIGGNGRANSGALVVHSGDEVDFTIGSNLRQSHAEIRNP